MWCWWKLDKFTSNLWKRCCLIYCNWGIKFSVHFTHKIYILDCGIANEITNGVKTVESSVTVSYDGGVNTLEHTVTYTCSGGFTFVPDTIITCNSNGSFTPSSYPECITSNKQYK